MYKVEETVVGYLKKNVPPDDEIKRRLSVERSYKVIKEKYPNILKEAVKLQEKLIKEAICNIGRYEVGGYHPLLNEAIEKEDFGKFYDEVVLEIVPDKTPWSKIYNEGRMMGSNITDRVNPLQEFGLLGEEKWEYMSEKYKVCLGRSFDRVESDGAFSDAEILQDYNIVSYLRLIYDVYKGIDLSSEEAIKILQSHGFLFGYSVEELIS